jgi:hypothetical protein
MKTVIETLEHVNKQTLCSDCRLKRKKWQPDDFKKHTCYSNMIPGFFSTVPRNIRDSNAVDVMIIANSHGGGGGVDAFRPQESTDFEVGSISTYYLKKDLDSYHQEQMRDLFQKLDAENISWYFTDLVKCFVKHKEENFPWAIETCKSYLDYQIKNLNVSHIICLGGLVFDQTMRLLGKPDKFEHGKLYEVGHHKIVASYFPSGFTSNKWVAKGKWQNVVGKLIPSPS